MRAVRRMNRQCKYNAREIIIGLLIFFHYMMSKNIALAFPATTLSLIIALSVPLAHAQIATGSQPDIRTYSTATSSTVIVTSPSGYKSEVISTYDGNQFHTFATSTPLTAKDIAGMQYNVLAEEQAMQKLFQAQQALFDQQESVLQNFWSNYGK